MDAVKRKEQEAARATRQLTVMWHEFMHAAKGGTKLADALIDLKTPNVPGQFGNRTANIYEIAKKCGTALPPGF